MMRLMTREFAKWASKHDVSVADLARVLDEVAYSIESGRSFHPKAAMDSTGFRPLVPDDSGQAVGA